MIRHDAQLSKNWRPWWRGVWIRNFDQAGEWKQEQWWRTGRELLVLNGEKVFVSSGKKKARVRKETNVVSGMRVMIVPKNQTTMPPHLPSHPCHEVEVYRRRDVSEAKVTVVPLSNNRADMIWRVLACDRLVNVGILPSVNFTKQKRLAKTLEKCMFPHHKVDKQPNKKPKKGFYSPKRREIDDKNAVAIVKIVPQLGCVLPDSETLESQRGKQSPWNPMQVLDQFEKYCSPSLRFVKQVSGKRKDHRLEKYKSNFLVSEVPTLWNLKTDLTKRLKDNSDAPMAKHGILPKI